MAESKTLFCASCGTVSIVEGNCPQCQAPMRKLGKVGAIADSKRATQMLIDESGKGSVASPNSSKNNFRRTQSVLEIESEFNPYPYA